MIQITDLANTDVGPTDLSTLAVAGVTKYFEERAMSQFVGNANMVSGAAKLAAGVGMDSLAGNSKIARGAALGFGVDGIEDILTTVLGGSGGSGAGFMSGVSNSSNAPGNQEVM